MTTLAPKLPYTHPFAGGYPRLGGQPLPTDPDAIDYLERVAAADGAAVEVGVAMAVDAFVKGCKGDGIWDAIKASCIMCGARTISGALVPLVGAAPTPYNFVAADYDRSGSGLKGDGSTKYLDSNRAVDADGQDDVHLSVYATVLSFGASLSVFDNTTPPAIGTQLASDGAGLFFTRCRTNQEHRTTTLTTGFAGQSRSSSASYSKRNNGSTLEVTGSSVPQASANYFAFAHSDLGTPSFAGTGFRLAFYSIGSATDLAALDNRVSTLVSAIAAAI